MKDSRDPYLGFDLGAGSGRAVLGFLEDRKLKLKEISRFANAPSQREDRWYWDFPFLWNHVLDAMRLCARRGYKRLAGVGVDTWGVDFGLLDAEGRLSANPMCYRDPMIGGAGRWIAKAMGEEELYRRTGTPFSRVTTLSQLVALAHSPAADTLKSAKTLLMMPDLFRHSFCGHQGIELTSAGSSQLLDVKNARWSAKVFRALRLPRRIMPEIVKTASVVGRLSPALAADVGLNRVPVVAVAGHDTASAVAASPLAGADVAFISCGTWLMLGSVEERPITTADALRRGFVNLWGVGSILFVKGMIGLYLFECLYRAIGRTNQDLSYADLLQEASQAKSLIRLIDANWPPFFTAEDTASAVADFLRRTGQKATRSRGALVRTLLEGLAWSCRGAIRDLAALTGKDLRKISLVGGGARNAVLCQMIADATGLEVIAGPAEASIAGNLALQALATKRLRDATEIRALILNSFKTKTYRPQQTELWDRHDDQHQEIVEKGQEYMVEGRS